MPGNTPQPSEGTDGRLLLGGLAGVCVSLMRWRLTAPENYKDMSNYCLAPMGVVGIPKVKVQCAGIWDVANPPHKYGFVVGTTVTLWLGIYSTTHGYLANFKIADLEAGHSLAEGGDFAFGAYQQGPMIVLPL